MFKYFLKQPIILSLYLYCLFVSLTRSFIFFMSESNLDWYGHVRQDLLYGHVRQDLLYGHVRQDLLYRHVRQDLLYRALMFTYFILQHLSTSPDQEPPHFEASVRAALVQIRDYPDPLKVMYPDGKPRCYCLEKNGSWTKI
jgi:hypothetical protein